MMDTFELPIWWDLLATFLYALVGTRFAITKGYDVVGVVVLSLIAGVGGGLLRDVLLQTGAPVALREPYYVAVVWGAAIIGLLFHRRLHRVQRCIDVIDAVSIGIYGVIGAQKSLMAGLGPLGAVFVGMLVGCGVLRDVLVRDEPEIFRPSTYYAVAVIVGVCSFVGLRLWTSMPGDAAAVIGITITVAIRVMAMRFGWRTQPLE
jgi:uncharacterized membrane protein YeiH